MDCEESNFVQAGDLIWKNVDVIVGAPTALKGHQSRRALAHLYARQGGDYSTTSSGEMGVISVGHLDFNDEEIRDKDIFPNYDEMVDDDYGR